MYTVPLVYRIPSGSKPVSVSRLHRALQAVVRNHSILHTALLVDTNGMVVQSLLEISSTNVADQEIFGFAVLDAEDDDNTIYEIIHRSDPFDLEKGAFFIVTFFVGVAPPPPS